MDWYTLLLPPLLAVFILAGIVICIFAAGLIWTPWPFESWDDLNTLSKKKSTESD